MYHNKTMKAMNKKTVLIVTPPLTSPAIPSFTGAFAAGYFLREAINAVIYDANLEFFVEHLFSTDFFKSESFYDPEKYLLARNQIDDLLLLYSAAFYSSRIRWSFLPGSVIDESQNPFFISFCHEKLDLLLKQVLPKVVILALDSETQVSGANTIIHYIKRIFPEIQTVVLQNKNHGGNNTPAADHRFSLQNPSLFLKWINTTWKRKNQDTHVEPDFSMFPLKEYLTPELILPLQTGLFKDIFSFWDFVAKLKEKYGAKGFLFEDQLSSFEILLKKKELPELFFGVHADMENLDKTYTGNEDQNLFSSGTTLIQWKSLEKKEPSKIKRLWDLSKQGIWNHVNLTDHTCSAIKNDWLRFISLNPNIAHSYENSFGNMSDGKPDLTDMDPSLRAYSGVKQLAGEPFWKFLSDPAHLLLYLKYHGKKNLFCLRADRANETLISLGSSITFHFRKPDELLPGFLDEICAMVEAGGSVDTEYVRYNLERAYLIGYAEENGIIVGNSSLKHPREEFIQRLDTITGLDFNHFVERGYTSVRPEYRALGVGARLLEGLTKRAGQYKIFSIISEDNTATHKIAKKNKTKKIAVYYSEKIGKKLGIWMPEHMIEKDWEIKL